MKDFLKHFKLFWKNWEKNFNLWILFYKRRIFWINEKYGSVVQNFDKNFWEKFENFLLNFENLIENSKVIKKILKVIENFNKIYRKIYTNMNFCYRGQFVGWSVGSFYIFLQIFRVFAGGWRTFLMFSLAKPLGKAITLYV